MNKKLIVFMAILGSTLGSYLPVLFGDTEFLDGWSVLGGIVGGFVGIWLGVYISNRFDW